MSDFKEENADVVQQQQLMTLADETTGESFQRVLEEPIVSGEEKENRMHSIKDFLTRFTKIDTVTVTESMAPNHVIATHNFPSTLLKLENYYEKCSGFKYLRGSIVVRVQTNIQIQQCMVLQCMMMPVESPNDKFNSQVTTSLFNASQTPGGVFQLAKGNEFEYTQPFVYPLTAYDMTINTPDYVTMIIKVLAPLRGNGTDITLTILARFGDDVEVSMPTSVPLYYTPTVIFRQLSKYIDMSKEDAVKIEGMAAMYKTMKQLQNQGIVDEQTKVSGGGPISSVLGAVGTIGSTLASTGIPVLSEVGAVGSVIGKVGGMLASAFGFSTPDNNSNQVLTFPSILKGINNSDYTNTHHQMALNVGNKLSIDRHVYGTPVDEMALSAIARTPTLIDSVQLTNTVAANTLLKTIIVTPMVYNYLTEPPIRGSEVDVSSMTLAACGFAYWRGSINYVIVPNKTTFHSARLAVVWFNGYENSPLPSTYDESFGKNFSIMLDLTESRMEYGFNVPYIQALQWLATSGNLKHANGKIGIYLINQLVNASNTSPTIDLLLYAYAGIDMQFAVPQTPALFYGIKQVVILPKTIAFRYWTLKRPLTEGEEVFTWVSPDGVESTETYTVQPSTGTIVYTDLVIPVTYYDTVSNTPLVTNVAFKRNDFGQHLAMFNFNNGAGIWDDSYSWKFSEKFSLVPAQSEALKHLLLEVQINRTECISGKEQDSIATGEIVSTPAHNLTIGEEIKSTRCLIKRAHPIVDYREVVVGEKTFIVIDALVPVTRTNLSTVPYKDFYSPAFRFQSGSMRYYLTLMSAVPSKNLIVYFLPNQKSLDLDPSTLCVSQVIYCPIQEGSCKIEVPFYNRNPLAVIGDLETHTDLQQNFHLLVFEKPSSDWTIHVAAGEDFSFGYYIGAPRMQVSFVTSD
nr:MAG: hypothetical protein 2 [Picornavirales sp.]